MGQANARKMASNLPPNTGFARGNGLDRRFGECAVFGGHKAPHSGQSYVSLNRRFGAVVQVKFVPVP